MPKQSSRISTPAADASVLIGSPLLAAIPKDDLQALVNRASVCSWPAERVLFQRGDDGDGIYAIVTGRVRIVLEGTNGTEVMVRQLATGDVFGEFSALDGAPRSASAIASTAVRGLHIDAAAFNRWLDAHPAVARPMLAQLAQRVRMTNDQLVEIELLDMEARIARHLWQRFAESSVERPWAGMRLLVNQRELAAEMGITRESVNKHVARWKVRGLVSVDKGAVVLLDPEALYDKTGPTIV